MDHPAASTERTDARSKWRARSRCHPVLWALAFSAVTTAGLGALAWGILIADALSYGVAAVITPETVAAPEGDRYGLAFAVGTIVNLGSASALAWLAFRTPCRTWPPVVQGLAAALVAAAAAASALLLTLGINPVSFVLAL